MSVSLKDINYIADLARIRLSEKEAKSLLHDMNNILEYMKLLDSVDTSQTPPLEHVSDTKNSFRKDEATESLDHGLALKNAPDANADSFRVPRVIE